MLLKEKFKFILFSVLVCSTSCTKEVDFEQANEFHISPVVESSLIFLDEPASQFVEDGQEVGNLQDEVLVNIFSDQFVIDHLVKAEFVFDIVNSINKSFRLQVQFLDEIDQVLHVMTINVPASSSNDDIFQTHIETFEGTALSALKSTQKMTFILELLGGIPLSETSSGVIQLKSKGVFYLDIDSSL